MAITVEIQGKKFTKFIPYYKILKVVDSIALRMNKDLRNKRPVFISILNGSFVFTADLLKKIELECEVSFIKVASYEGARSSGTVSEIIGLTDNIKGRTVVLLEDIVDSGNTLERVVAELQKLGPKTIKIATLFFKPQAYNKKMKIEYIGLNMPDDFIVGYGLDYNGYGRNLPDIYILK